MLDYVTPDCELSPRGHGSRGGPRRALPRARRHPRYFADVERLWDELVLHAEDYRAVPGSVIVIGTSPAAVRGWTSVAHPSGPGACATAARCRSAPPTWVSWPEAVLAAVRPDADVEAIARDVAERLQGAVDAWGLTGVHELAGGNVAVVCAADQPVVLKVNPRMEGLSIEAAALRFWRDTGAAVELLDARDDDYTLLLERLEPGTPTLADLGRLVARLHAAGPPPPHFPHLRESAGSGPIPTSCSDFDLHAGPT